MALRRGITQARGGGYRVRLPREEREVLASLPQQLRAAFADNEPTLYRLFPPAYLGDPAANEDYHRLVGEGLVDGHVAALTAFERTVFSETLTEDELGAWLGALESLRLALGTELDVTEVTYSTGIDPADPNAPRHALYHYLSWLQEEVVAALASSLPGRDDDASATA